MSTRTQQREASRQRLLDAARSLMAGVDPSTVSTADVARAAETAVGTVFFHFGTRQGLLEELAVQLYLETVDRTRQACADDSLAAYLHALVEVHADPQVRLLWSLGDLLGWTRPSGTEEALAGLRLEVEERARLAGLDDDAVLALGQLLGPAALLLARRAANGSAGPADADTLLDAVAVLLPGARLR